MFLKIIFDKAVFVKFKISNNFKQNIVEKHSKQPEILRKIYTSLCILKIFKKICKPKASRLSPNVCDLQNEAILCKVWVKKFIENL
jgi:hypothetical protein